jgi:hypothetical protein
MASERVKLVKLHALCTLATLPGPVAYDPPQALVKSSLMFVEVRYTQKHTGSGIPPCVFL